tara:strand:+ start:255 stop:491 length:237 start_codon:yes stop_codon:yes gene_type:complete
MGDQLSELSHARAEEAAERAAYAQARDELVALAVNYIVSLRRNKRAQAELVEVTDLVDVGEEDACPPCAAEAKGDQSR